MFKRGRVLTIFIFIFFVISFFGYSYGQDPGAPDTVRFEQWGTCVPCPPCSGTAVVPMVIFNDEELYSMEIPIKAIGPISFDSGRFVGERAWFFEHLKSYGYFGVTEDKKNMVIGVGSLHPDLIMPPGNGIFAHIYLTVDDTGFASIEETGMISDYILHFFDTFQHWIVPVFDTSEMYIGPQDILPGDADANDIINLSDAISLARYILMGGPPPVFSGSADVNTDCNIDLSDVILIALWYFYAEVTLQPGCAY